MAAHRRVVASAPRSRTFASVLGSALRCTSLASRKAVPRLVRAGAYFSRPMRPMCVSWKDVESFKP
jgi:hypothetical protein